MLNINNNELNNDDVGSDDTSLSSNNSFLNEKNSEEIH